MNNLYLEKIKNTDNPNELVDMFFDFINNNRPNTSLPYCLKIFNKVKKYDLEKNNIDLFFLQNELRNIYIFLLDNFYEAWFKTKIVRSDEFSTKEINERVYLGFNILCADYDTETKDFIADTMISDIINNTYPNYEFDIEKELHIQYRSKEIIEKVGINKIIIDFVSKKDKNLGDYVMCHSYIVKPYQERISKIIDDFDTYEEISEKNRYNFIVEDITEYCNNNNLNVEEYLFRLMAELNIINKVINHSGKYDISEYVRIKDIAISASRNEVDFNYLYMKKIAERYLKEPVVKERIEINEPKKEYKEKLEEFFKVKDTMSKKEQLIELEKVMESIKNNDELDDFIDYIYYLKNNKNKNTNILKFKKNNESE